MRGLAVAFLLGVPCLLAQSWPQIRLEKVAGGFTMPTTIVNAGDGSGRLFITEQRGRIRVLKDGAVSTFLDIASKVSCCGERGLVGLAFPPGYTAKKYFYVYYTDTNFDITLARYRLGGSPDAADPASETALLKINHRQAPNHNGGGIVFGPDGFLYMGTGDGGGSGDSLGNSQNPNALLAKLLRLDVESGETPYGIPPSNPFVNTPGFRPEIWAWGLRNPWRYTFDRANGDLYIADVGQDLWEEIDFQPAGDKGGENYGWNIMEGSHCFRSATCNTSGLTMPVAEYGHSGGDCSVIGGAVYRGARFPAMRGIYFYSDYCTGRVRGLQKIDGQWQNAVLLEPNLMVSAFGEDETGELYLADWANGDLYMFAANAIAPSFSAAGVVNAASYQPGLVPGSLASLFGRALTTAAGVVNASGLPLPAELNGTSVSINGRAAPLIAVASVNGQEQINFAVPQDVPVGKAQVTVRNNGRDSAAVAVDVLASQPALFTSDGTHAAAQHADYTPVSAANPAQPNEIVLLYGTGFGSGTPQVTIGGRPAQIMFSGLAPQFVGLYQMNVTVPADAGSGDQNVVITVGGKASPAAKLSLM